MIQQGGALALLVVGVTAVFLPGSLVPDTLDMCNQAVTDHYSDWHSPILAGVWGFFDPPPELIFATQNIAFVSALYLLLARRLRGWAAVGTTWLITLLPTTLGWLGHIGKDQWFVPAFLFGIGLLARVRSARSERARTILFLAACGFLWLAVAARQNAIVPAGLVLLAAGPVRVPRSHGGHRAVRAAKRVAIAGGIVIVILITQVAWTAMVVRPEKTAPQQATFQFDLAALSARTGELLLPRSSLQPSATLEDVISHLTLKEGGGNALFFEPDSPLVFMIDDPAVQDELARAWREAILDHPIAYLRHRLAFTSALLGLSAPYPHGALIDDGSRPESFGMRCPLHERYFPALYSPVSSGLKDLESTNLVRGWWVVIAMIAAAAALGWRDMEARMLVVAGLGSLATFAAFGIGPAFRYFWFSTICTVVLVALVLERASRRAAPGRDGPRRSSPDTERSEEPDRADRPAVHPR